MAKNEINETLAMSADNAVLLLAAAEELGLDAGVVETTSDGVFRVPQEVVDKAGLGKKARVERKAPVKRAAAKRAPAKKAEAPEAEVTEQKSE